MIIMKWYYVHKGKIICLPWYAVTVFMKLFHKMPYYVLHTYTIYYTDIVDQWNIMYIIFIELMCFDM